MSTLWLVFIGVGLACFSFSAGFMIGTVFYASVQRRRYLDQSLNRNAATIISMRERR